MASSWAEKRAGRSAVSGVWPSFSKGSLVVVHRNWWAWRRFMVSSILANLAQPILSLLALGLGVGLFVQDIEGMPFVQFIAPGLLVGSGMVSVTFDVCYGVFERLHWTRAYHSMIASPLMPAEIVAGEITWQAMRTAFFGTGFLLILIPLGLVQSWWALTVPLLAAVVAAVFAAPAIAVAAVARTEEQLNYYFNLVIQPMFFFAGVFFPIAALGEGVQKVAQVIPLYHAVTLARMAISGEASGDPLVHVGWLLGFVVVLWMMPVAFLRQALERVQ